MALDDCVTLLTALREEKVRIMELERDFSRRWNIAVEAYDRAYAQGQTTGDPDRDFVIRAWREDSPALSRAWRKLRENLDAHDRELFLMAVYREFSSRWKYYCGIIRKRPFPPASPCNQASSIGVVENFDGVESVAIFLPVYPYMVYQDTVSGPGSGAFNAGNFAIGQRDLREYLLQGDSNAGAAIRHTDPSRDKILWIAVGSAAIDRFCSTAQENFLIWLEDAKGMLGLKGGGRRRK